VNRHCDFFDLASASETRQSMTSWIAAPFLLAKTTERGFVSARPQAVAIHSLLTN
jgi:hypothetical protein